MLGERWKSCPFADLPVSDQTVGDDREQDEVGVGTGTGGVKMRSGVATISVHSLGNSILRPGWNILTSPRLEDHESNDGDQHEQEKSTEPEERDSGVALFWLSISRFEPPVETGTDRDCQPLIGDQDGDSQPDPNLRKTSPGIPHHHRNPGCDY